MFTTHSGETDHDHFRFYTRRRGAGSDRYAKVRNDVLIEDPSHKRRRRLQVLNNRPEHDHLVEVLRTYGRPVVCAFEAKGNYHRPIAWRVQVILHMLKIEATQRYHDPLRVGINDVQELSKTREAIARQRPRSSTGS